MIYSFGSQLLSQLLKWSSTQVKMRRMATTVEKGLKVLRVGMIC
jgi:hypothetical protein